MYCLYLEYVSNLHMYYRNFSKYTYIHTVVLLIHHMYFCWSICIIVCVWLFSKDTWHVCIVCFELTYTCMDFATSHVLSFIYIYISNSQKTFFSDQWANGGPQDYESAGQIMFQVAQVWVVVDFALIVWGVENAKNLIWEMRKFIQFVWKFGAMERNNYMRFTFSSKKMFGDFVQEDSLSTGQETFKTWK